MILSSTAPSIFDFAARPAGARASGPASPDDTLEVTGDRRKRDALAEVLIGAGLEFVLPEAESFVLIRSPIDDEQSFTETLARHGVLVVPGRACGAPGFVRASFAVDDEVIASSLRAWQGAVYEALGMDSVRVMTAAPRGPAPHSAGKAPQRAR